jgi:hypothetical protein
MYHRWHGHHRIRLSNKRKWLDTVEMSDPWINGLRERTFAICVAAVR